MALRKPGSLLQRIALLAPAFHILHSIAFRKAADQARKAAVVMAVPFWNMVGPARAGGCSYP